MNLIDSHKSPEESENLSKVVLLWGKNVLLCLHNNQPFHIAPFKQKNPTFQRLKDYLESKPFN